MKDTSYTSQNPDQRRDMLLKTRVFELCKDKYKDQDELAQAMKIPVSRICGVQQGKYSINQKFIIGAIRAFTEYNIGDLFYFTT